MPVTSSISTVPINNTSRSLRTGLSRVLDHIKDATYGAVHRQLAGMILVSLKRSFDTSKIEEWRGALASRGGQSVRFQAKDGAVIEGMHFIGKECSKESRTIVLFSGNWFRFEEYATEQSLDLKRWLDAGYNVLIFNYRGVGGSKGRVSREGLIFDGEAAVRFVRDDLQAKAITVHGHSLGGGIGAEVAVLFPEVAFCADRTFASLSKQVKCMHRVAVVGTALAAVLKFFGWDFNVEGNWDRIRGKKWIVHFAGDKDIVSGARLAEVFAERVPPVSVIRMDEDKQANNHIRAFNDREAAEYFKVLGA